jgi:TonB-linked SusC/RagA family outer membrane protein
VHVSRTFASLALLALAWLAVPRDADAQAAGRIAGQVVDSATRQAVPNAQVFVVGTTLGARTADDGRFAIVNVPVGTHQVRVLRLGYAASSRTVTVASGEQATADFELSQRAALIEGVVTTATGETQEKRELGNAPSTIEVPSRGELAAVPSFSNLVTGRAAGVAVQAAGGTTGSGARIRIRGSNSVSLSNDPIIIIDGVRVDNATDDAGLGATSLDVGGQVPSRFDDLNPEDIESIEVIKGPAGLALYGTGAANGVIQITTRRGRAGEARWNSFYENGAIREVTDFPNNYRAFGKLAEDNTVSRCRTYEIADGTCQLQLDSIAFWNPLENVSPFVNGRREQFGANVSGGTAGLTYYLAADREAEDGVYEINKLRRTNLRANFRSQISPKLDLSISSGYLTSDLRYPQNDNNSFGIIPGGVLGSWRDDPVGRGYFQGYVPTDLYIINTRQQLSRFTGSSTATWQPLGWLRFTGVTGLDLNNRYDNEMAPGGVVLAEGEPLSYGFRQANRFQTGVYTTNVGATATRDLPRDLRSTSSVGVQYNHEIFRGNQAYGEDLLSGTGSLNGTNRNFQVAEVNQENITLGGYVQQQLAWRERLFLTGALRGDENSAFGADFGFILYPSLQASWVIAEEPWFPQTSWLSSLRLRTAYGQTGQRPAFRQATTFYSPVTVMIEDVDVPAVAIGGSGNPNLEPERSAEIEAGFDVGLMDDRATLALTYYDKSTRDALVARILAPSLGSDTTQFVNLGEVSNRGLEAQLDMRLLRGERFGWDATLNFSVSRNRVVDLGENITPIIFGLGGDSQRHQNGYPLGAYFARPILGWNDADGNGVLGEDEVEIGDDPLYMGTPFPTRQLALTTNVTLFEWMRVSALAEYRGGNRLFNSTEEFRCGTFVNCKAMHDPSSSLEDQAAGIAALFYATPAGYMQDADFVKLREVAITFTAPSDLAQRVGASAVSLTLAGRNLATWTEYKGFDPEINGAAQSNFSTFEFFSQPLVRYYTSRITVTF